MSEQQWRMNQLERQVKDLEKKVERLTTLRDQLAGMGNAAKGVMWVIAILGSWGLVDGVMRVIQWLRQPISVPGIH